MTEPQPDAGGSSDTSASPPAAEPQSGPTSDTARLESLMAQVPPSSPGWSAPPSRLPQAALWLGIGAFTVGFAVVLDLALVRQGQRSIVAGGILGIFLLAGVAAAIAAITAATRVRSTAESDGPARLRAVFAIGLAAVALLLMTLAGLELYSIGLDAL